MHTRLTFLYFIPILILYLHVWRCFADVPPNSAKLTIVNNAHHPVDLYWVNDFSGPEEIIVKQNMKPIRNGSELDISSYGGHNFMIKYWEEKYTGEITFTKGSKDERVILSYDDDINNFNIVQKTTLDDIMDNLIDSFKLCDKYLGQERYFTCMAESVSHDLNKLTDGKDLAESYLASASERLRNYTCLDPLAEPTTPISSHNLDFGDMVRTVDVLLDMPAAKVWYVDNFLSQDECNILIEHGRPRLERASVADADGSSMYSESRKAQQATYEYIEGFEGNRLWNLSQRVFGMVNSHIGLELNAAGQEPFTIIQYNIGDQYTPHCDGNCVGGKFLPGARIATALMYCMVPTKGGDTLFTRTDLIIRPKVGAATFFSYRGEDGTMDDGSYTEHSGCPIIEGEKWVITLWMREGVTFQEPWEIYDTDGVKMFTREEDQYVQVGADEEVAAEY